MEVDTGAAANRAAVKIGRPCIEAKQDLGIRGFRYQGVDIDERATIKVVGFNSYLARLAPPSTARRRSGG